MQTPPNTPIPTPSKVVKVVHIDDDPVFLHCVKAYVEQNPTIRVTGQYISATHLLSNLEHMDEFDVLIIDYILPEMNGSELLTQLRNKGIKAPVISFTAHSFPEYVSQLKKDGIRYSLAKNQLKYLEALLVKCADGESAAKGKKHGKSELTPDDVELLILSCNGRSREQMADKLCIGVDAVKIRKVY